MNNISFDIENHKYALTYNEGLIYGNLQPFTKEFLNLGPLNSVFIIGFSNVS